MTALYSPYYLHLQNNLLNIKKNGMNLKSQSLSDQALEHRRISLDKTDFRPLKPFYAEKTFK